LSTLHYKSNSSSSSSSGNSSNSKSNSSSDDTLNNLAMKGKGAHEKAKQGGTKENNDDKERRYLE